MADSLIKQFSRNWPFRVWGLPSPALPAQYANRNQDPILGFVNQAQITAGTGAAAIILTAGQQIPGAAGKNMTLTINAASGSLTVSSNALDISITPASGGSHAAAVVAAINAQFPSLFVVASLPPGSAGGTNVATLAKTNFTATQRAP
jgi:hypothetical protein